MYELVLNPPFSASPQVRPLSISSVSQQGHAIIRAAAPRAHTLTVQRQKTPLTMGGQTVRVVSGQPGAPQIINVGAGSTLGQKIISASPGTHVINTPVSYLGSYVTKEFPF